MRITDLLIKVISCMIKQMTHFGMDQTNGVIQTGEPSGKVFKTSNINKGNLTPMQLWLKATNSVDFQYETFLGRTKKRAQS